MYSTSKMAALSLNGFPSSIRVEFPSIHLKLKQAQFPSSSFRIPKVHTISIICCAPKSNTVPHSSSSSNKNRNNKNKNKNKQNSNKSNGGAADSNSTSNSSLPTPLPKPPAGFIVDECGKVLTASKDRLATLVDPTNNLPLEGVIRRVFKSSQGDECMLLCPVDMPVQILKSTGVGWSDVGDEELGSILPAAAYALAKLRMYLVHSGYCYTARGGFCYSEEDIFDFHADGKEDGLPTEGVEITHFNMEGEHYMIYTPSDPLLFVAVKDQNGMLQIADDELLEDPAVISAIDEETEFNALVEEEAALLDSLLGKR
ncbi:uncharacterized protein LOC133304060 [Gastrolobium bilobum]|uniref:uncharacterized protein LOC133304060 n=1 Tax=Gastrolobium bilobum TaxID=150636 RepID=UPI002AB14F86|nr:uncharacterized protein LOC133304060 [Gastrolobium bilobum]